MTAQTQDPRITELLDLAAAEGLPLAVRPETVCALEDAGWTVNPFSCALERADPLYVPAGDALRFLVHNLTRLELAGSAL